MGGGVEMVEIVVNTYTGRYHCCNTPGQYCLTLVIQEEESKKSYSERQEYTLRFLELHGFAIVK